MIVLTGVVAALLHERAQVATARRNAQYARARQVYEARRAILIAKRVAVAHGDRPAGSIRSKYPTAAQAGVANPGGSAATDPGEGFVGPDGSPLPAGTGAPARRGRLRRKPVDDSIPAWVFRPLRPSENPRVPWWVRARGVFGLSVLVGVLAVAFTGMLGLVVVSLGLLLDRFAG